MGILYSFLIDERCFIGYLRASIDDDHDVYGEYQTNERVLKRQRIIYV